MQASSAHADLTSSRAVDQLQRRGRELSLDLAGCTSNWASIGQHLCSCRAALQAKEQQLHNMRTQHMQQQQHQVLYNAVHACLDAAVSLPSAAACCFGAALAGMQALQNIDVA